MSQEQRNRRMESLSLIGLGRIKQCADCPRYRDLVARQRGAEASDRPLAAVPRSCTQPYCAPLAARHEQPKLESRWNLSAAS